VKSPTADRNTTREPFIDLLRFFAASSVVIVHAAPLGYLGWLSSVPILSYFASNGGIGVDVFFIISGYVIFMSARNRSAANFVIARLIRLWPSLLLVVTSIFIYFKLVDADRYNVAALFRNLTLTFNLDPNSAIVPQTWTLVYEVKFYGAIAILLLMSSRIISQARLFLLLVLAYEVTLLAFTYFDRLNNSSPSPADSLERYQGFHLGQWGYLFVIGCCLSILKNKKDKVEVIGAIILIFGALASLYNLRIYNVGAAIVLGLTICVILVPRRGYKSNHFLSISYALGGISYPLYLIHYHLTLFMLNKATGLPVPQPLLFLSAYAITVLISFAIFRFYEMPLQRYLKKKLVIEAPL
jgi:peptidoglycan/LPS O-acetylase OafA/YrhL